MKAFHSLLAAVFLGLSCVGAVHAADEYNFGATSAEVKKNSLAVALLSQVIPADTELGGRKGRPVDGVLYVFPSNKGYLPVIKVKGNDAPATAPGASSMVLPDRYVRWSKSAEKFVVAKLSSYNVRDFADEAQKQEFIEAAREALDAAAAASSDGEEEITTAG